MNKPEILIIDDEHQIRKLLQISLESNGYRISQATNAQEGIIKTASHPPDLIILDIGLPDKNGHDVLVELKAWYNNPIIILSVLDNENDIVKALDNGASDYLSKPFRMGELIARIRASLRRNQTKNINAPIICNDLEIDLIARVVKKNDVIIKLTSTEYSLISLLAKNEGMVLTHQFILKEIWGIGAQNETQYLRVYIAQLRKKLEENPNNPKHIITESGIGYRFC